MYQLKVLGQTMLCVFVSAAALAEPAVCGKFTATVGESRQNITIVSQASDFVLGSGFTFVQTTLAGKINKSCRQIFDINSSTACSVKVNDVKLVSDTDCWATAPALFCQEEAKKMVRSILEVQEKKVVRVTIVNISAMSDDVGNTIETFDIQGYVKNSRGKDLAVRAPSRVDLVRESDGCALLRYSVPNAN